MNAMIPVDNPSLFDEALLCLAEHKRLIGRGFKGRFIQVFLGLKYFQDSIPSMYSGSFIATEVLQALLDDLFAKASRPANSCVLSLFEGNYLARTGLIGPGNATPQNTWRNNLNLQKGIGCYAPVADLSSHTFLNQERLQCRYLQLGIQGTLQGSRCSICGTGAAYRSENHRKWLRIDPGGAGYAATDLQNASNFVPYVSPGGMQIPVLPLIVALYHDADPGLGIGARDMVNLDRFASDFNFSAQEILAYFDTSRSHPLNMRLTNSAAWNEGVDSGSSFITVPNGSLARDDSTSDPPIQSLISEPVLGGTPVPPPNTNNGWGAEQYVASALEEQGWIVYVVSRQQLGYDIFAQRGIHRRYIEVKSSVGPCSPALTAREWQQARYHSNVYILAIVENFNPARENVVHWVRDPANCCTSTPQSTVSHRISRSSWASAVISISQI